MQIVAEINGNLKHSLQMKFKIVDYNKLSKFLSLNSFKYTQIEKLYFKNV